MDRLYLVQEEYIKDRYNIDESAMYKTIKLYANRNLDRSIMIKESELEDYLRNMDLEEAEYIVPVGNLNYVQKYLETVFKSKEAKMVPIEIPEELYRFTHRFYVKLKGREAKDRYDLSKYFVKDIDKLKNWNNLLYLGSDVSRHIDDDTNYSLSEVVDIVSEYRVFVLLDKVIGCKHYLGDVLTFPDKEQILKMIEAYENNNDRPNAYTLDVGVIRKDDKYYTVPLEVHSFVSCGLYGFYEEQLLYMLAWGIKYELDENRKRLKKNKKFLK